MSSNAFCQMSSQIGHYMPVVRGCLARIAALEPIVREHPEGIELKAALAEMRRRHPKLAWKHPSSIQAIVNSGSALLGKFGIRYISHGVRKPAILIHRDPEVVHPCACCGQRFPESVWQACQRRGLQDMGDPNTILELRQCPGCQTTRAREVSRPLAHENG